MVNSPLIRPAIYLGGVALGGTLDFFGWGPKNDQNDQKLSLGVTGCLGIISHRCERKGVV